MRKPSASAKKNLQRHYNQHFDNQNGTGMMEDANDGGATRMLRTQAWQTHACASGSVRKKSQGGPSGCGGSRGTINSSRNKLN